MSDDDIIAQALSILESRLRDATVTVSNSTDVRHFLRLRLGSKDREVFAAIFLDTRHRIIEYAELFFGTIDKAMVYPREIARKALEVNAAAVVLAHNHPSGVAEPSTTDRGLTEQVKRTLELFEIRTLDHVVVSGAAEVSFAERGLL